MSLQLARKIILEMKEGMKGRTRNFHEVMTDLNFSQVII